MTEKSTFNPVTGMGYWEEEVAYNKKTLLYVGGLDEKVSDQLLMATFIPFGDIVNMQIPRDEGSAKHRGFGFVEYAEPEDAQHAMENMNDSELLGRILKVNIAKPTAIRTKAVWDQADQWYAKTLAKVGLASSASFVFVTYVLRRTENQWKLRSNMKPTSRLFEIRNLRQQVSELSVKVTSIERGLHHGCSDPKESSYTEAERHVMRDRLYQNMFAMPGRGTHSGRGLELYSGWLMQACGNDVEFARGGADGGADLRLFKEGRLVAIVQCKMYKAEGKRSSITIDQVRSFKGAMAACRVSRGIFITTTRFTSDAEKYCTPDMGIELVDNDVFRALLAQHAPVLQRREIAHLAKALESGGRRFTSGQSRDQLRDQGYDRPRGYYQGIGCSEAPILKAQPHDSIESATPTRALTEAFPCGLRSLGSEPVLADHRWLRDAPAAGSPSSSPRHAGSLAAAEMRRKFASAVEDAAVALDANLALAAVPPKVTRDDVKTEARAYAAGGRAYGIPARLLDSDNASVHRGQLNHVQTSGIVTDSRPRHPYAGLSSGDNAGAGFSQRRVQSQSPYVRSGPTSPAHPSFFLADAHASMGVGMQSANLDRPALTCDSRPGSRLASHGTSPRLRSPVAGVSAESPLDHALGVCADEDSSASDATLEMTLTPPGRPVRQEPGSASGPEPDSDSESEPGAAPAGDVLYAPRPPVKSTSSRSEAKPARRNRRRKEDIPERERWYCPRGCATFYRKTSTVSRCMHMAACMWPAPKSAASASALQHAPRQVPFRPQAEFEHDGHRRVQAQPHGDARPRSQGRLQGKSDARGHSNTLKLMTPPHGGAEPSHIGPKRASFVGPNQDTDDDVDAGSGSDLDFTSLEFTVSASVAARATPKFGLASPAPQPPVPNLNSRLVTPKTSHSDLRDPVSSPLALTILP